MFDCPTRESSGLMPHDVGVAPFNADWAESVARTDYAVNEGDTHIRTNTGPATLSEGDTSFVFPDTSQANGVSYVRSLVSHGEILDGLSNTYLVGEKWVFIEYYLTTEDNGYDQSLFAGADLDTNRATTDPPAWDGTDMRHLPSGGARIFGSAHPSALNMAFNDGHVARISYSIDPEVHRGLGNRHDGLPLGNEYQ